MFLLPSEDFFPNRFQEVMLPTKREIFARTGQVSVSPSGSYSGDDIVKIGLSNTESADSFANAAEDLPEDSA